MSNNDYLRERAESYVRRKSVKTEDELLALSPEEIALTLHELQVHQIELMMQNDELRRSHAELDAVKARYFELYDMAPVCYCTVSQNGIILQANLTTCTQLSMLRHSLLNLPLSSLIFREDQDVFYRLQKRLTVGGAPVSCELRMVKQDQSVFWVTLTVSSVLNKDGVSLLQVIFSDISERKQVELELLAQKARLQATLDALPDLLFEADENGRIYNYHAHRADLIAPSAGMVLGKRFSEVLPEGAAHTVSQAIREAALNQYSSGDEYVLPLPQGERWFELSVASMSSAETEAQRFILLARDITERKRAEVELRIAAIAFESQEGMMVTGPDAVILRVNQAFTSLTGYSAEEAIGWTPRLLCSGRHDPSFYQTMRAALKGSGYWQGEIWNKRKNGEIYAEWLTITAVKGDSGEITHYIGTFSDITANEAAAAEIHRLAYYDPLTHLPNRRMLQDRLAQALVTTTRTLAYGAVLFIDLDNFKVLNDLRGHDTGDLLLMEVAQRLQSLVRESDTVARLGGDEFVVLLEELHLDGVAAAAQALQIGEKILSALSQPYLFEGYEFYCTASIGVDLFFGTHRAEELLKHADMALYQAKSAGRNTLRFFDPVMQATIFARAALEADLRHALENNQLRLYFQSQVVGGRQIVGAEVLLRWEHPERGLVLPADFISLAEKTGLILPVGLWVLDNACAQLKLWAEQAATRDLQLAVNVSARQFRQPGFVAQVAEVIDRYRIDPGRLKLELTESMVLENVSDTVLKMNVLRAIGVRFSMDDFGTGFSSLAYLTQLPLNQLKIDQSFVHNLGIKASDAIIVQTIIGMAHNLGMEVIAEGVETEAQRVFLDEHGCPSCQGYLFSKPVPIEQFEALLLG
jgi:diguanylate cyclase (GGDEF)-like protein/PAS domain S-box-containing protein